MPGKNEAPPKIRLEVNRSTDYRTIYVTGGMGAMNPQGAIVVHLYNDNLALPPAFTRDQESGKETAEPIQDQPAGTVNALRTIETSAVMDAGVARALGEWLINRADEAEKLTPRGEKQ